MQEESEPQEDDRRPNEARSKTAWDEQEMREVMHRPMCVADLGSQIEKPGSTVERIGKFLPVGTESICCICGRWGRVVAGFH
ncbi:MAG: hypothetical protein GY807_04915 [Gammaproteobacteria bacterium]|nr:hypothetical protein [Gammaproteobacteria bacterium]